MRYVTLDTGLSGAMILFHDGIPKEALTFRRMGMGINSFDVARQLKLWKPEKIYVEEITVMPQQGAKSTATQFFVVGQCHTLAQLNCGHVEYIHPRTWSSFTKRLSVNPHNPSKVIAQELAPRFFPQFVQQFKAKRGKKFHDGITDCLCIDLYVNRDRYVDQIIGEDLTLKWL